MEIKLQRLQEKIKEIYGDKAEEVLASLTKTKETSFFVNTLKKDEEAVIEGLISEGFKINAGALPSSFVVIATPPNKKLSESGAFNQRLIYIQDQSSMVPVLELDPKEHENILDLCAAPGSKSTQIVVRTRDMVRLVAVEKSRPRFFTLKNILEMYGIRNATLLLTNGIGLDRRKPEYINHFDKILIDAPCTNEGLININDPKTYKFWNLKKHRELSRVQEGLLLTGVRMLKPGGTLIYSTCTFSVEENELVVDWLLKRRPEVVIKFPNVMRLGLPINYTSGRTSWKNKTLDQRINQTVRILPQPHFMPFYFAKIIKPK